MAFGGLHAFVRVVLQEGYLAHSLHWLALREGFRLVAPAVGAGALAGGAAGLAWLAFAMLPGDRRRLAAAAVAAAVSTALIGWFSFQETNWMRYRAETAPASMALHALLIVTLGCAVGALLGRASGRTGRATWISWAPLLLAGVAAAAVAAFQPTPRGPNLLLISVDTLRADRLSVYGYSKASTSHIDALARAGTLWETVVASAPVTLTSTVTLMTGLDPQDHGVRYNGFYRLDRAAITVAEVLANRGYATSAVIGNFALDHSFRIDQGFVYFDDHMTQRMDPRDSPRKRVGDHAPEPDNWWRTFRETQPAQRYADEITDGALQWLDAQDGETPFFMWVHYMDPHKPYSPPRAFARDDPYDGEVAFTDSEIGRLLGALDRAGLAENTLVALVSDHGESLGEHDYTGHVKVLYDQTLLIPFIMRLPGVVAAGRRISDPLRGRDVAREILRAMGIDDLGSFGTSADVASSGSEAEFWAYSESFQPRFTKGLPPLQSMRGQRWKYIRQGTRRQELYDLEADPGESTNLAGREAEVAAALRSRLEERAREGGEDRAIEVAPETYDRLKALGYVD